jgi:hypothetical protein
MLIGSKRLKTVPLPSKSRLVNRLTNHVERKIFKAIQNSSVFS